MEVPHKSGNSNALEDNGAALTDTAPGTGQGRIAVNRFLLKGVSCPIYP